MKAGKSSTISSIFHTAFHAEASVIFDGLDMLDAILRQPGRRAADRAEIEAAMLLARGGDCRAAIALGQRDEAAARRLELVDEGIHAPGGGRAERARGVAGRRLGRAGGNEITRSLA